MSNPHYNIHGVYSSPSPSKKQVNRGTRTSSFDSPPTQPERNTGGNTGWRDEKDDSGIDMSVINAAKKRNQDLAYKSSLIQQQKMSDALNLSRSLQKSNISKSSWERMMDKGSLSPEVALQMGLATKSPDGRIIDPATGEGWIPKGQLSKDMIEGMQDLQFMQDEGVYGGTFGAEAVTNELKGNAVKETNKLSRQIAQRILNNNPGISDEELDKEINAELKKQVVALAGQEGNPFSRLTNLWGGDKESALMNTFGMQDTTFGSKKAWDKTFTDEHGNEVYTSAKDVGYDPTATKTFSGLTEDEYQNKFLQRGTLWDDPLSGTLSPGKSITTGGGSGPGGGGGYGGGGGGGGGGDSGRGINYGSGSQVYQRGFPGAGDLQERVNQAYLSGGRKFARGGIVSLLRL
jgi:uncharacterized membrane protein YgcG|tara:strand:+ start:1090 stop:2301 length:1212 start_codon:yes stop_codon:yes gene_type:complete